MKKLPIVLSTLLLGLVLTLVACYPDYSLTTAELDVVITDFDEEYFDRNAPRSYHMPDTVVYLGEENDLDEATEAFILSQVSTNFDNLGWTRKSTIDENDLPDVVVAVSVLIVTTNVGGCIPWYPGWGYYPWYPGWGWGPGWCYPVYAYSYDTGSLLIDMVDPEEIEPDVFRRVWSAGINGLLRSSNAGNREFISRTIDQSFDQSPYLEL